MTEKRFELKWRDTGEVLYDNETGLENRIYAPDYRFHVRDMMNELADENEQLKIQLQNTSDQRNEFYHGARENANRVGQLEKENKTLKQTISDWQGSYDDLYEDNLKLEKENKELKKENNELKQQFILLLKKLGKKNVQCSFCEHGEHYSELVEGYYEPRFICHKKGQEDTQRSFCEDWKIKVKE